MRCHGLLRSASEREEGCRPRLQSHGGSSQPSAYKTPAQAKAIADRESESDRLLTPGAMVWRHLYHRVAFREHSRFPPDFAQRAVHPFRFALAWTDDQDMLWPGYCAAEDGLGVVSQQTMPCQVSA